MKILLAVLLSLSFMTNAAVNVREMGAGDDLGNSPYDNLQIFNNAIEVAKKNNHKLIYVPSGTYTLSDTWVVPSTIRISGDNSRLASQIIQNKKNAPVIANEAWYGVTDPKGNIFIEHLWLKGSNYVGINNHCLVLTDYYSTVQNMYLSDCGGHAMYFSSERSDGSFHTTSSLVQNTFKDSYISNSVSGFRNGSRSDKYTPKLTDGRVQNIDINLGSNTGEVFELYEAAGWHVDSIHTYAHKTSLKFDRASMLNVSNVYTENKGENDTFFNFTKSGHTINLSNIMVGTVLSESDIIFDIAGVSWVTNSVVNISNLNYVMKDVEPIFFKKQTSNVVVRFNQ